METLLRAGLSNAVAATLMALLVTCLSRPMARRPAILHGLWLLVLLKLVTPPFYQVPVPWPLSAPVAPQGEADPVAMVVLDNSSGEEDVRLAAPTFEIAVDRRDSREGRQAMEPLEPRPTRAARLIPHRGIAAIWLAGSSVVLVVSLVRIGRFQRLLREARPGSWQEQDGVDDWARRLGLRRPPDLYWVPGRISPMIWWIGTRPRLIVPRELWKQLDSCQQATLIAHELAHLKRGDHYVRLLELLVTALFWWHPLVWWLRGSLRDVEEQCCDAWVVWALPDAARAYAETLLDTLEFLQPSVRPDPLLASGLGKAPHLRRRLTMIMTGTSRRLPGLPGKLGILAFAGVLLPVGASWAQKATETVNARIVLQSDDLKVDKLPIQVEHLPKVSGGISFVAKVSADQPTRGVDSVVVQVNDLEPPGQVVELSGSLEDVMKKLQARIAEAKAKGETSDAAKARVKALEEALEALKKASSSGESATIVRDVKIADPANESFKVFARRRKEATSVDRAEEIARTRNEIARLRKSLNDSVDQLTKAQAKLRELGEDPGDSVSLRWQQVARQPTFLTRAYTVTPRPVAKAVIVGRPVEAVIVGRPVEAVIVGRPVEAAPATDQQRFDQLEKKLKSLQDEFERLKKGADQDVPRAKR